VLKMNKKIIMIGIAILLAVQLAAFSFAQDEVLQEQKLPTFFADNIRIELSQNQVKDVTVDDKETLKATLFNEEKCTVKCTYSLQGFDEKITEGLNPGQRTDFNIIFFVPEDCREPCSITAHVVCNDKQSETCPKPMIHETDVSFDLIEIRSKSDEIGGFIILGILAFVIFLIVRAIRRRMKNKKSVSEKEETEGKRKLSAIMFTDMKGFSREVGQDEEKTLKKLWRYEKALKQIIKEHEGRIVKTIGDAIMGDFDSAVNAVKSAIEIQRLLKKEDIKIRIGIHLGDVIHKAGDIFGDGVNIASRIESICEPGEIYISEDVYNQVKGKVGVGFENLGSRPLKNIESPPKVFRIK